MSGPGFLASAPRVGALKPVRHDLKSACWCGLAAVATITGKPTSWVLERIKRRRARLDGCPDWRAQRVTGTTGRDLRAALEAAGYTITLEWSEYTSPDTLAQWARSRDARERSETYILTLGNPAAGRSGSHWVVVRGGMFCDNHTRTPVRLARAPHRRRRVTEAFVVQRLARTRK